MCGKEKPENYIACSCEMSFLDDEAVETVGHMHSEGEGYTSEEIPVAQGATSIASTSFRKRSQLASSEFESSESEVSESEEERRGRSGRTTMATARLLSRFSRENKKVCEKEKQGSKDDADGKVMSE